MRLLVIVLLTLSLGAQAELRARPVTWAQPILKSELRNFYLVEKGVYRSKQPVNKHVGELKSLGIKEVLNLRHTRSDRKELGEDNFRLHQVVMDAGNVSHEEVLLSLKIIKYRKGPILVHCHHGADRTGVTMAAYRIIFNNWSKAEAIDEMSNGGYGHKVKNFPNLVELINNIDVGYYRKQLGLDNN